MNSGDKVRDVKTINNDHAGDSYCRKVRGVETTDAHKQAKRHTRTGRHMLTDTQANTQQLSAGFQNKGINHHYTHTHKRRTRVGRG